MVLKLPILYKTKISQGTWEMGFDIAGKDFKYAAGQYIKITQPEVDLNHPKGNLREFSLTSAPGNKTSLTIVFRESDSDFKQALLTHSPGDKVQISGPFGDFFILPKDTKEIVMIAGGMGINPFLSMLTDLRDQKSDTKVYLIYVNSKPETVVYLEKLIQLKKDNKHLNFIHQPTRLVKKDIKSYLDKFDAKTIFMVAGPPDMVRDTRLNLFDLGIERGRVIVEEFTGYLG